MSIFDRARDALDKATPGPWRSCAQQRHPTSDCYVKAEDGTAVVSAAMPEWASDGVAWNNGPLVALAPETAAAVVRAAKLADSLESRAEGDEHSPAEQSAYRVAALELRAALEGVEE